MIEIYTDGSSERNGDPNSNGGYGIVIINPIEKRICAFNGFLEKCTSNQAEITAAIESLRFCESHGYSINLFSDSQYLVNTINKKWKKKKNVNLWENLDKSMKEHTDISFKWVKGHSSNLGNCIADKLASRGTKKDFIFEEYSLEDGLKSLGKALKCLN